MSFKPAEVARECSVTVNTVRNWCKEYSEFLSPGARPASGQRELSARDVEVLKYIAQLRKEDMPRAQIAQRLQETAFGTIEPAPRLQPSNSPPTVQASQDTALAMFDNHQAFEGLVQRLATLERIQEANQRQRRDSLYLFVAGVLTSAIFFLIILLIAWLFGSR